MPKTVTICKGCHQICPLIIDEEEGRPTKVYGKKDDPLFHGYSCIKGREVVSYHEHPSRLLKTLGRGADGELAPTPVDAAIDAIAARLKAIIAEHGPRSVAVYSGTAANNKLEINHFAKAFLASIGSKMYFNSTTIDQPGKFVGLALHGSWNGGEVGIEEQQVKLMVGMNPTVSVTALGSNAARNLHQFKRRGGCLIIIDPRRSEAAEHADFYLQCKPGEDPTILAGLIRCILTEGLWDKEFVTRHAVGLDGLRRAVEPFTPEYVAKRAGIDAEMLPAVARAYTSTRMGNAACGTGPNMSPRGTLTEYLIRSLNTLAGQWLRAGDVVPNPGVLIQGGPWIESTDGPVANALDTGEKLRVGSLTSTVAGMPTGALADEIVTPGEGQVRALIVAGGNPMQAWPDQIKALQAMKSLDLLVCIDAHLSGTARVADYVIAPKMSLEMPTSSASRDMLSAWRFPQHGYERPYGLYVDKMRDPPAGSDVIADWEFFYRLARAMGLQLKIPSLSITDPVRAATTATVVDMETQPSFDDVFEMMFREAPVPFATLMARPGQPAIIDLPPTLVQPTPEGWQGRLDLANATMLADLADVAAEDWEARQSHRRFRLLSRRMHDIHNSDWQEHANLRRRAPYNPAYMNPQDMETLGLAPGQRVEIVSDRASLTGIVQPEAGMRPGCVSMAHGWGGNPDEPSDPEALGANTGLLSFSDRPADRYTGIPLMSSIPIDVRPSLQPG